MNLDHLRSDQVRSDQSEIWQSHMRLSSANVIDAPRVRDQDFRADVVLRSRRAVAAISVACEAARGAGQGGRLILITLDAFGTPSAQSRWQNRMSWHHFIPANSASDRGLTVCEGRRQLQPACLARSCMPSLPLPNPIMSVKTNLS